MRPLHPPDWGYFAAAWSVVVVGLGFMLMSEGEVYGHFGRALVVLGLLLVLFSLRPSIASLPAVLRFRRWNANRKQKKREQELAEVWVEPCRAWDEFHRAASGLRASFYDFRDMKDRPDDWQKTMNSKWQEALTAAGRLHDRHRPAAERLILRFSKAVSGEEPLDAFSLDAVVLQDWLMQSAAEYRKIKQSAGL